MYKQIETFLRNRELRRGFTLMELMIVLIIIVILMAVLFPVIYRRYETGLRRQAQLQVDNFTNLLKEYYVDTGTYPTMQQGGLQALIDRPSMTTAAPTPMTTTPPTGIPIPPQDAMQNGTTQLPMFAPQGPVGQVGPNPQGGMGDMTGGMGGMGGMQGGMGGMTGGMGGMQGGMGDMTGGMGGMQGGMGDMIGGMGGMQGSMGDMTGGMGNPGMPNNNAAVMQIRAMQAAAKWNGPYYTDQAILPQDPWKREYFYEYPTDKTLDGSPAVWSAGKDGISGNEDDLRNWDPAQVALERAKRPQIGMGGMQGGMGDMTGGMGGMQGGMDGMGTGMGGMGTGMGGMGTGMGGMGTGMGGMGTGMDGMGTGMGGMGGMGTGMGGTQ